MELGRHPSKLQNNIMITAGELYRASIDRTESRYVFHHLLSRGRQPELFSLLSKDNIGGKYCIS